MTICISVSLMDMNITLVSSSEPRQSRRLTDTGPGSSGDRGGGWSADQSRLSGRAYTCSISNQKPVVSSPSEGSVNAYLGVAQIRLASSGDCEFESLRACQHGREFAIMEFGTPTFVIDGKVYGGELSID